MEQIAAGVILVAAALSGLATLAKRGPIPWLWRRNVVVPIREFVGGIVDEKLNERPFTNGRSEELLRQIVREEVHGKDGKGGQQ